MTQIGSRRSPEPFPGASFDVVALAASAGGLQALIRVLSGLPGNFPAAIAIVQHLDPRHRSLMADIFARRTALKVKEAEEGDQRHPAPGRGQRHRCDHAGGRGQLTVGRFAEPRSLSGCAMRG